MPWSIPEHSTWLRDLCTGNFSSKDGEHCQLVFDCVVNLHNYLELLTIKFTFLCAVQPVTWLLGTMLLVIIQAVHFNFFWPPWRNSGAILWSLTQCKDRSNSFQKVFNLYHAGELFSARPGRMKRLYMCISVSHLHLTKHTHKQSRMQILNHWMMQGQVFQ